MFSGAHIIIYTKDAEADRAFCSDTLGLSSVDVGQGWLVFKLPASELAFHPSETGDKHEFYLLVDDVQAFIATMKGHDVACEPVKDEGWGLLTQITLPGGSKLGVYEPRHARPE